MNLRESITKSLALQELYKSMMWHLQHDAKPEAPKQPFGADELERLYGSKSAQKPESPKVDVAGHLSKMHTDLTSRGFTHFPGDGGYDFYRKDDHTISVNKSNGQWVKSKGGKGRTLGSGAGDLQRYFNQYGNR